MEAAMPTLLFTNKGWGVGTIEPSDRVVEVARPD